MARLGLDRLRRTPEWEEALRRAVESAVAAGKPRYVKDTATLDSIAAMVIASRRSVPRKNKARGGAPRASQEFRDGGQASDHPST